MEKEGSVVEVPLEPDPLLQTVLISDESTRGKDPDERFPSSFVCPQSLRYLGNDGLCECFPSHGYIE